MPRTIDKTEMVRKMFDEGEPDDLMIEAERSAKRVTIREESNVSIIKRRSPAQFIPLSSIVKRSDAQVRLVDFDPEKYPEDKSLLESIRNRGLVSPVAVKEYLEDDDDLLADTKYELIYGHRRVSACKVLGWTTIPAFIIDSTVNSAEVTMTENTGVRTLNAYERAREFANYLASHDISIRAFADRNGYHHSFVSEMVAAYRKAQECPDIEVLFKDGQLRYQFIPALVDIYSGSGKRDRDLLIGILPELSTKQTRELIEYYRTAGSAAGYLNESGNNPVSVPASDDPVREDKKTVPALDELWNALESDKGYTAKQAGTYGCTEADVRKAVKICRSGNAGPEDLRCMLLIRKNGGKISERTLEVLRRVFEDSNTQKAVSLYIAAYEKLDRQKAACRKRFGSAVPAGSEEAEILDRLLGIRPEDLKKDNM